MNIAWLFMALAVLLALVLGVLARGRREMVLDQWTVAGRGFGAVFVFLLLAGEIYTTFTFLGASGFAYGLGGPAFYILAYGGIAYTLSYFILPPVWRYARQHGLISQPDFFARKYASPALGVLVSLVDIVALVPYLVLQFKGLGIIVHAASYGAIGNAVAIWIGALVVTIYVMVSGVRGSAWTSVVKDIGILAVVIFLGLDLPWRDYGGIEPMFRAIAAAKPGFLALPEHGQSVSWFISTVLLTALGFFMWPHSFAASYTARSERTLRKNAVVLPLYQFVLLFVYFVGFAAILKVPGLKGADIDLALFHIATATFSPAVVGIIGGIGILTALVPGSLIMMNAATLLSHNLYRLASRNAQDAQVARTAKGLVLLVALVAVGFTLHGGETIVALLLMGYSFVTQLFPALLMSLLPRNPVTPAGAFAGIAAGVATVAVVSLSHSSLAKLMPFLHGAWADLNVGIVALGCNVLVLTVVSLLTPRTTLIPAHREQA